MYKINKKRITINFYLPSFILIIATSFLIFMIYLSITEEGIALIPIIFALVIMIFCIKNIKKWSNKLSSVKKLEKNGKLIKNLPYDIMIETISSSEGSNTINYFAVVNYKEIEFISLVFSKAKDVSNKKYIDLIYDENDISNYYLDFDIEEVGESNE